MPKRTRLSFLLLLASASLVTACGGGEQRQVIQNKGSDTLVNVAQAWAEAYQTVNPAVVVAVSGGGSGTGIAALINGTVDIANASRAIKDKELKLAKDNGQNPVKHEVPGCQDQEIVVVSRQNNSGTYAYFRQSVLGDKDFKLGTRDMHGSKDVVDLVEKTPCAIGYSGLAYATDHIKMACVAQETGGSCTNPSVATAVDGSYPIARPLFMYTNGEPTGVVGDYMNWIKSNEGQCIILEKGYAPAIEANCG
jgi:phosphate transport system substrate-binding protein